MLLAKTLATELPTATDIGVMTTFDVVFVMANCIELAVILASVLPTKMVPLPDRNVAAFAGRIATLAANVEFS